METEKKYTQQERERIKESKEQEVDPELAKASVMERADILVKEVKTNQKQLQNIALHMQQVMAAIKQLRQQLQIQDDDQDPSSIQHDKEKAEQLKKKIGDYIVDLEGMKDDILRDMVKDLKKQNYPAPDEELLRIAEMRYNHIMKEVRD